MSHRIKIILFSIFYSVLGNAENIEGNSMGNQKSIPPEVMAYIAGANSEKFLEFNFLIGSWSVEGVRVLPDRESFGYRAKWNARYINDKRMVVDDFKILSPDGMEVSSYVTLRSYSPISKRWELSGLAALSPSLETHEWYGNVEGEDMLLHAKGVTGDGKIILNQIRFFDITENQFKWVSNLSFDNGESWFENGSLVATRIMQ